MEFINLSDPDEHERRRLSHKLGLAWEMGWDPLEDPPEEPGEASSTSIVPRKPGPPPLSPDFLLMEWFEEDGETETRG